MDTAVETFLASEPQEHEGAKNKPLTYLLGEKGAM